MSAEELARIQQAHHRRLLGVQQSAGELMGQAWDSFAGLDDAAAVSFTAAAEVIDVAARQQVSTLAVAYMQANDRLGGFATPAELRPILPTVRGGVPTPAVFHRSIVEARTRVARGASYQQAMASGRARAVTAARTDVTLANRDEMARGGALRPWVVGYRRVLTGQSCAFCATASTQRYHSADLLPLHPLCDCDVAEIFGTEDPGQIVNRDLLDQLKQASRESGHPRYWDGPYIVDEKGVVRYRRTVDVLGEDGKTVRRVVPGERVVPEVVDHGELGATLTDAGHVTTTPEDLAPPSTTTDEPRRTRAKVTDPDVLAEASRRNVSPERVIQLREEAAQRRYLEDRARREAEKALTVDSPEVRRVAERFGVDPEEVLSARARVADVRKLAREEAARVQADAVRELDRLDCIRLRNPPRAGSRTGMGTAARRGEWDWLEQLSERERARLSRRWYGGTSAPDQFAHQMSAVLGRDMSVDDAIEEWLRLNRREEAAGALRRGRLPSLDAYSGQIDPADILSELADRGYDPTILFGDDLTAAGHVASVEREALRQEAMDYLGAALNPTEGPAPWRMSYQAWEDELRDLEHAVREGFATPAEVRRYAELVPEYLDEPGLSFEELHARIVATARRAGEEIPDLAALQAERDAAWKAFLQDTKPVAREVKALPEPPPLRPHPDSATLRDLVEYADPKAEKLLGDTVDRLSALHGGPKDTLEPTRIVRGGKTSAKGGHFAPEGKRPPRPARTRGKSPEQYRREYEAWLRDNSWRRPEIRINDRGDGSDRFSLIHEIGHRIDFIPRSGVERGSWASLRGQSPEMVALRDAIQASTPYRQAVSNFHDLGFVRYYRSPEESWARAYSQWAAQQLGGAEAESFRAFAASEPNYQWSDEEFAVIGPLVEAVLRARGFLA